MNITHVMPSLGLALAGVQFVDGKIKKAEVVNGFWTLFRNGAEWQSKSGSDIVSRWPVKSEDDFVVELPKDFRGDYNEAIWLAR